MKKFFWFILGTGSTAFGIIAISMLLSGTEYLDVPMVLLALLFFLPIGIFLVKRALADIPPGFFYGWLGIAGIFLVFMVVGLSGTQDSSGLYEVSSEVCDGTAQPEAAAYMPSSGKQPLITVYEKGSISGNLAYISEDWRAESLSELEIVSCVSEEWEIVEVCEYEQNAKINRKQHVVTVDIREAKNGRLLTTFSLKGELPRDCLYSESFMEGEKTKNEFGVGVSETAINDMIISTLTQ